MNDRDVQRLWQANAEGWTTMARAGFDQCRDLFNTPAFLELLPPIRGLAGIDIGCGEGHNTRLLARRGARMIGLDLAPAFVHHARQTEVSDPLNIDYLVGSASRLPCRDEAFDFATALMCFQDVPRQPEAVREAYRVLKPGGFLQFSITHPCFQTPKWGWVTDGDGRRSAVTVGDYFLRPAHRIEEWTFGAAPEGIKSRFSKFRTAYFDRTLSDWLNLLLSVGFTLEEFAEPCPSDEVLSRNPDTYDARIVAYFLIVRVRK